MIAAACTFLAFFLSCFFVFIFYFFNARTFFVIHKTVNNKLAGSRNRIQLREKKRSRRVTCAGTQVRLYHIPIKIDLIHRFENVSRAVYHRLFNSIINIYIHTSGTLRNLSVVLYINIFSCYYFIFIFYLLFFSNHYAKCFFHSFSINHFYV